MTNHSAESKPRNLGKLAAFRYRDFRLFWTGLFISNIGTWMQMTAINWLLYEITNSPLQLGINGIFRAIPAIGLGLVSGTFADRYDRKRLLLATQMTSGILAFFLATLDHAGFVQAWHIYAFTFLSAAVNSIDNPARQALFPSLIPRSALPNAVALNSLLWKGASLIGPSLGGVAISLMGTSGAFYANAASYVFVVIALMMMHAPSAVKPENGHFMTEVRDGFAYVFSQQVILGVMVMEAVSSVFGLNHAILTIFASDVLSVGASGFGFLLSARGLGAVLGSSVLIGMGQVVYQGRILFVSAVLYGLGFALFGLSQSFLAAVMLMLFIGGTDTIWAATRSTILQLETPDRLRGRVMGVFGLSNRGLHPLGQLETGVVVPLIGARSATVFGGLLVTAVTLATAWRVPGIPGFRWDEPTVEETVDETSRDESRLT